MLLVNDINIFFLMGIFIFGLLLGSFLNVVIYRLPKMLMQQWQHDARAILELPQPINEERINLLFPASHCSTCKVTIKPWSNIPVISFLLQKGRCSACHEPISWQYPLVELITACTFAIAYWQFNWGVALLGGLIFTAFLITMIFIDAKTQLLPDSLTLPLLWLGLLFNIHPYFTVSLNDAILGAVCGYMSLWIIFQLFKLITGKEGMGYGDFKLLAALGAWLGYSSIPIIILLSSLVGIIFAVLMKVGKNNPMPFGPYLAISGWIVLVFNQPITQFIQWWLSRSGF